MAKRTSSKLPVGAIIGLVVLGLVAIGGGVGLFLATHNTDSRSQASAVQVAQFSLTPRTTPVNGVSSQQLGVDMSQLNSGINKGATVANFYAALEIGRKDMVLGVTTLESEGLIVRPCTSNAQCAPQGVCYRPPAPKCTNGRDCRPLSAYCVPRVTPTRPPVPTSLPSVMPTAHPFPTMIPTKMIPSQSPTVTPVGEVLAQSEDGLVSITGTNFYKDITDLQVSISMNQDSYYVSVSGTVKPGSDSLQKAFINNVPFLVISMNERPVGFSKIFTRKASIMGYLPRMRTLVDLTQLSGPTSGPSGGPITPPVKITLSPSFGPTLIQITGVPRPPKGQSPTPYPTGPRIVSPSPTWGPQPPTPTNPPYPSYDEGTPALPMPN